MDFDFRWPLLLLANLLLLCLLRLVNEALGPWGLTLFMPALFLLEPALGLRMRWALLLVGITGLAYDAYEPLPFGFSLVLFASMTALLYTNRQGLRRASTWQHIWVLICLNAAIWLLQTLILGRAWLSSGAYWQSSLADLALSSVIIVPVGFWFLSLQHLLTDWINDQPDPELEI